ncbi:MAG: bifunctional GNAT family N-acetyltransferase/carbon-nitrogen hydrolase family protein [Burkholderiales bacterium]|nr:MAG: bifunctional GNAT family N-acetyltransferase/carbon-nitrogen hydrolase family protein [Burkholderiales bacterium]
MDNGALQAPPAGSAPARRSRLRLRHLRPGDYPQVAELMARIFTGIGGEFGGAVPEERFRAMLSRFPEGQIAINDRGRIVGVAFSLIIDYRRFGAQHTYAEITGDGQFTTHEPGGDVLYGADVFVDPAYRSMRIGRRLYDARKELCRKLNLRAIVAGGRIPGYHAHAERLTPAQYVELVRKRKLHDPILSFQLANDFRVHRILRGYLEDDRESHGFATLIEWQNVAYEPRRATLVGGQKRTVRVGAVQWQMRAIDSIDDLLQQVEFFVDSVSDYKADFVVFPEFFNIALMGLVDQAEAAKAMRRVADFTPQLVAALGDLALRYNINIVGGSLPVLDGDALYNEAYLFKRNGDIGRQRKLHITPVERRLWALQGGNSVAIFETDAGTVGILICYDVEFPELPRILAERGMQILFVPFWTETKNGFQRVRHCAQARAIENECYVVLSGSVGNLPRVDNVNVHYSQIAILSPADFAFPHDAVVAESTANAETVLIADVDLSKLRELHEAGSVRNLKDRRHDLYRVAWVGPTGQS